MRTKTLITLWGLLLGFGLASLHAEPDLIPLGPFGGDVRSLASHPARPQRVYLGTADGQIFASDNRGRSWHKLTPGIGRRELVVDALAVDPENPDVIWAGGWELKSDRGGLYRSSDAGRSWSQIDLGIHQSSIRAVAVAPTDSRVVAVGITEGVLLSKDGGKTWDRISRGYRSLYNVHSLAFDPHDANLLYVGTWRLAWKTPDLGKSWIAIHKGMYWDSDLFSFQIDPAQPQHLLAGACSGAYRSSNGGTLWERVKNGIPASAKRTRVVRFDPVTPGLVYAGTTEGLYRSKSGGDRWELLLPGVVINSILIDPEDSRHILLATDDAGVLATRDGGQSFEASNEGFCQRQISYVASRTGSRDEVFASVTRDNQHGGFFWSEDGGKSWKSYNEGLGELVGSIRTILPSSRTSEVLLGTSRGVYRGVPGKEPWALVPGTGKLLINGLQFLAREGGLLIASREGVFRVMEGEAPTKIDLRVYDRTILCVLEDSGTQSAYIGTEMGVFRSDDQGRTWKLRVEGLPYVSVNALSLVQDRLFAATRQGLYYTDDRGDHWIKASGIFPIEIAAVSGGPESGEVVAADPLVGYLFTSQDLGTTWTALNVGRELSRIQSFSRTPSGELLAGTLAEGVYRILLVSPSDPGIQSTSE